MTDYLQIVMFLLAMGDAAVRSRIAPVAAGLLFFSALAGIGFTAAAIAGAGPFAAARFASGAVAAISVVIILEKRALVLERQVTQLAQQLAIANAQAISGPSAKDSAWKPGADELPTPEDPHASLAPLIAVVARDAMYETSRAKPR